MAKDESAKVAPDAAEDPNALPQVRRFTSLSVLDLIEAREAYHVYLSNFENVVATAIGRYRIRKTDWYAQNPPDVPRPKGMLPASGVRTLRNSIVRPWSWPCVLVFVRRWGARGDLGARVVPQSLFLPDGRVVPTCVIQAAPDESPPPSVPGPSQSSALLGGGYSCLRRHQGVDQLGTISCLVHRDGSYYALTNRHVAGRSEEVIQAYIRGTYHPVGRTTDIGVGRVRMSDLFPAWPGESTYLNLDAGLVFLDDINDWTAQAFGIGEIGPAFDATEQKVTLDLIGCPVRAFGGTSGVLEGEIQALFFQYESAGGREYSTDVLIGPRTIGSKPGMAAPFTHPGDSGTLWFYDPPSGRTKDADDSEPPCPAPDRGARARRLRPVAMQWGGMRIEEEDGTPGAFALGSFISSVCRSLDVEIVRDWSTGHDEYWGKLGHFAIGWKACDQVSGSLAVLMKRNRENIGFGNDRLGEGSHFSVGRHGFVPLADVPDYVWTRPRKNEAIQHFADIDIPDIDGGSSLMDLCERDPSKVSAGVWKAYFDGFAAAGVGPNEGALPLRIWQVWDDMVSYLKKRDVIRFLTAAGVLAHYAGDASQAFHCSYLHHGIPPMVSYKGREYPVRKGTDEDAEFKQTAESKIHSIYEETMLETDTPAALAQVDRMLGTRRPARRDFQTGQRAAVEAVLLMARMHRKITPKEIVEADDPSLTVRERGSRLWNTQSIREPAIEALAESVWLLADLWSAAWSAGGGDSISPDDLVQFEEPQLEDIYHNQDFLPSMALAEMVANGKFVAKAARRVSRKRTPKGSQ